MRLPFSVPLPADSPYGVLFAFVTASSGVRNVSTDSTGPKISSRAIRCDWLTPVNTVGGNQKPRSGSSHGGDQRSAPSASPGAADLAVLVHLLLRVDRAVVGVLVQRVAEPQRAEPVAQPAGHRVGHRFLDQQPGARAADVALVE